MYTYLIGWSKQNVWYYGCRFKEGVHSSDLWKTYFTSSKYVKEYRFWHGDPDVIQIRREFIESKKCQEWEHKVLKRLKVINNPKWLNKTDNKSISLEAIKRGGILGGKNGSREGKRLGHLGKKKPRSQVEKMIKSKTGVSVVHDGQSKGGSVSGPQAFQNKTGIHAISRKETTQNAIKGKNAFLLKMQNPEFRKSHGEKIKAGKLAAKSI